MSPSRNELSIGIVDLAIYTESSLSISQGVGDARHTVSLSLSYCTSSFDSVAEILRRQSRTTKMTMVATSGSVDSSLDVDVIYSEQALGP